MREEANGALSEETVSICGAYSLVCQHEAARGKAFLFAKSMHWISGPSPSPQVTQRDGALIKRLLFRAVHVHVLILVNVLKIIMIAGSWQNC